MVHQVIKFHFMSAKLLLNFDTKFHATTSHIFNCTCSKKNMIIVDDIYLEVGEIKVFLFPRSDIGEEVLVDCLKYMDSLLDKVSDHTLLEQLYSKNKELCKVIVLSANKRLSLGYVNRTLKLSVRFLQLG